MKCYKSGGKIKAFLKKLHSNIEYTIVVKWSGKWKKCTKGFVSKDLMGSWNPPILRNRFVNQSIFEKEFKRNLLESYRKITT